MRARAGTRNTIEYHGHLLGQCIRFLQPRRGLRPACVLQLPDLNLGVQRVCATVCRTERFVLLVADPPSFKLALEGQAAVRAVQQCLHFIRRLLVRVPAPVPMPVLAGVLGVNTVSCTPSRT